MGLSLKSVNDGVMNFSYKISKYNIIKSKTTQSGKRRDICGMTETATDFVPFSCALAIVVVIISIASLTALCLSGDNGEEYSCSIVT